MSDGYLGLGSPMFCADCRSKAVCTQGGCWRHEKMADFHRASRAWLALSANLINSAIAPMESTHWYLAQLGDA